MIPPFRCFWRFRVRLRAGVATCAAFLLLAACVGGGNGGSASSDPWNPTGREPERFIGDLLTDGYEVFRVPEVPKPSYLSPVEDPTFHTDVTRVVGDSGTGFAFEDGTTGTWGEDARHHYSDDQPWNANSSLIIVQNAGSPGYVVLDGDTYRPKYPACENYPLYDDRWHPALPQVRINVSQAELMWFDVVECRMVRHWDLPFPAQGDLAMGPTSDGRYIALSDDRRVFVVDMDPKPPQAPYPAPRIGPARDVLADCGFSCTLGFAALSPSGRYLIVHYQGDRNRVFDVDPETLALTPRRLPVDAPRCIGRARDGFIYDLGHLDMTANPFDSGEDVIIGQEQCGRVGSRLDGELIGGVVMVRLRDGAVSSLTDPRNEAHPYHISATNVDRPGWVYVTYWPGQGERFNDEIVAVKLDDSGTVQRFGHTHTDTADCYRCEAHAVPSPNGRRIMFASAWNANCANRCGSASNPQAYVIDARARPGPWPSS
jgi:hypothetical protein